MALFTVITFHFRQRFALELGEAVAHDMRSAMFRKLMGMPMSFFNRTKFGRIISRLTSDIDSVRVGCRMWPSCQRAGLADDHRRRLDGVVRLEALLADGAAGAGDLDCEPALPQGSQPPDCAACRRAGAG